MKQISIIMGSDSDLEIMKEAANVLDEFKIPYEITVVSAHRTPDRMFSFAKEAKGRGIKVIIAGAGGAAHLPGMVASITTLPVIGVPVKLKTMDGLDSLLSIVQMPAGVPVKLKTMDGLDSLLSIVQMPAGVPVATVAINNAKNAGILAAQILGTHNEEIAEKIQAFKDKMKEEVEKKAEVVEKGRKIIGY